MKRIYQVTALAGTILAGAGGLAFAAADHDGMRGERGRPGHHHMHKGGHGGGHGYHKVGYHKGGFGPGFSMRHIDGSLAFLKAELKITDAQEPQWQKVDAAIRSAADRMQSLRPDRGERGPKAEGAERGPRAERPERPQLNPVERLERMEKMASAASESAREVRTALAPLYDPMSEDQKETADKLLRRMPFRR